MGKGDWVPFDFLLGEQYSGYFQAINASRDLKVTPSKLPKLFWGLSHEQRRRLATKMLEGHIGDDLENAIRAYVGDDCRRRPRGPTNVQPWITADGGEVVSLNGRGADGRPISPLRYRPRAPFLTVNSEEACLHLSDRRVEKPQERAECGPARKRREIQELMRKRVQMQEEYLAGVEVDRKDWRRHCTYIVKKHETKSKHKLLRRRLRYNEEGFRDTLESETSFDEKQHRQEKAQLAQLVASVRTANRLARAERASIGRWERDVLRAIRDKTDERQRPSAAFSGAGDPYRLDGRSSKNVDLNRALGLLGVVESFARDPPYQPPDPKIVENVERVDQTYRKQVRGEGTGGEIDPTNSRNIDDNIIRPTFQPSRSLEIEVTDDRNTKEIGQAVPVVEKVKALSSAPASVVTPDADPEDSVRQTVQTLLRVSSTVAMVTARPLGIKLPPILAVDKDEMRASALTRAKTTGRPSSYSFPERRSPLLHVFRGGGYRNSQRTRSSCVARGSSSSCIERAIPERRLPFQDWPSTSAILDLGALSAAGSDVAPRVAPACPSGRFAPMTEEEIALFLPNRILVQKAMRPSGNEQLDLSAAAPA